MENLKKKEKSSLNLPVCSFQSQLLILLLHTRIRMSRNDPSRLLRDNLETAAKVTIMQHTWLHTGRRYPIVFAEKQLNNVFLMLFVLPSGCRVYHPTRGEWGGEFFRSLFMTKVLKGQGPPSVLSGTLPYPPLPGYAPNPPTPLSP